MTPSTTSHKGLLLHAPEVRAFLEGRKTQHRLPMKTQAVSDPTGRWTYCVSSTHNVQRDTWGYYVLDPAGSTYTERGIEREAIRLKSHYQMGDLLYLRETCALEVAAGVGSRGPVAYRADCDAQANSCPFPRAEYGRWLRPQHMKRANSRADLAEVTNIHPERLQDMTEADALAEGVSWTNRFGEEYRPPVDVTGVSSLTLAADRFREQWEKIHGEGAWKRNDWVFVYTLKRVKVTP